jgi:hypothetical protein
MKPSLSQAKPVELSIVKGTDIGNGSPVTLRRTQPVQYSLFQQFLPDDHSEDYSNTIELYDAIPKYFSSKKRMAELREGGTFLRHLERRFKHGGKWYTAKILPSRLEDTDGQWREYYPSPQEELVEEALKKIACDRLNGVYLNDTAGVQFTLYELRKELEHRGHSMNFPNLITSLQINRRCGIVLTNENGETCLDSPIFPVLVLSKRRQWEMDPKNSRCYVQFNPLVTHSINTLRYRQFNYVTFMKIDNQLARCLLKRLSHNYIQANILEPYTIKHSTIVRDSGLINFTRIRDQVQYVSKALDELTSERISILLNYRKQEERTERNRILDVTYTLTPHPFFVTQVKKANKRGMFINDAALRAGVLSRTCSSNWPKVSGQPSSLS